MAKYLLIASRDPFEYNDVGDYYDIAKGLAQAGNEVILFLVQNGVLPARKSACSSVLEEVAAAGVTVLADDFSLRERGITPERLTTSVSPAPLDTVIDQLVDGAKTMWN
jgi:predicted peroxiredoxin